MEAFDETELPAWILLSPLATKKKLAAFSVVHAELMGAGML